MRFVAVLYAHFGQEESNERAGLVTRVHGPPGSAGQEADDQLVDLGRLLEVEEVSGIVDELLLYVAPYLLGDPARGMFALPAPLPSAWTRVS